MSVSGGTLRRSVPKDRAPPATGRNSTYIKIIRVTHFQTTIPPGGCRLVAVTDDVFEIVAASPLAGVSSYVAFHCVVFGKVVPRAHESDCLHRRVRLTVGWVDT